MEIVKKIIQDRKDVVSANHAVKSLTDLPKDKIYNFTSVVIFKDEDVTVDGEVNSKHICALKIDGEFYTTISPTVYDSLLAILDMYEENEIIEGEGAEIILKTSKSNKCRQFLFLNV